MKISTAEIKMLMLDCAKDKKVHVVDDFKHYISEKSDKEYTSGQISGAVYQLSEIGMLEKVGRGLYQLGSKALDGTEEDNENEQEYVEFRGKVKLCLQKTEQQLEQIVEQINVWELTTKDFEFLGEIKRLNEQMKEIAEKC